MRRSPPRPPPPPPPPLYPILGLMTKVYEGSGGASQARSSSHRPIRSPQRELHKDVFTKLRVKCAHSPVPLLRLPKTRVSCGRGMKKLLTPLPWPLLSKKKPPRLRPPKRVCTPRPHSFQGGAGGGGWYRNRYRYRYRPRSPHVLGRLALLASRWPWSQAPAQWRGRYSPVDGLFA